MKHKKPLGLLECMFAENLRHILEISGLSRDAFFNGRSELNVAARVVFVSKLIDEGWSERMIADMSGMSQQRINSLKNSIRHKAGSLLVKVLGREFDSICGRGK